MKTSNAPFVSLVNATFRLGDRLIFPNTNWEFRRNEHWAIVGPNGSGKSLFADALRAAIPLVGGEMEYHFRPVRGLSPEESISHVSFENRRSELHGAVVQSRWNSSERDDAVTVGQFLSYEQVMNVNPFEVSADDRAQRREFETRRRRAISLLRLAPFLERPLLSLSNGETQRAQLARALSHPMRMLILDEPFIGLDAATRAHLHGVLEKLMAHAVRVLLITTRVEDLPAHITHVLRVENCRVAAAGKRKEIIPPAKPARFAGRVPVARFARREMAADSPILAELKNVSVRYGASVILRDLTWTVRSGESWALLGANGSGKTTLLSLILGDNPQAYSNEVTVFGQRRGEGESMWDIKRRIGWVSPELQLHFDQSAPCFDVVGSGFFDTVGLYEALSAAQRRDVRACLKRLRLAEFAGTPFFALSPGLQRMVLLARALVKRPALLILDEPCQGLDLEQRTRLVATVDALIRSGTVTAIYVSHHRDTIPPAITRILRLERGVAKFSRRRA